MKHEEGNFMATEIKYKLFKGKSLIRIQNEIEKSLGISAFLQFSCLRYYNVWIFRLFIFFF